MKHFKRLFLALAVVTLVAIPCAADDEVLNADFNIAPPIGGDTGGNGNCLNSYNNCLIGCNGTTQGFTNAGCKIDCWYSYYGCLYNSATG